jgi:hypothetical protein
MIDRIWEGFWNHSGAIFFLIAIFLCGFAVIWPPAIFIGFIMLVILIVPAIWMDSRGSEQDGRGSGGDNSST